VILKTKSTAIWKLQINHISPPRLAKIKTALLHLPLYNLIQNCFGIGGDD
jgi:hypothetical protein